MEVNKEMHPSNVRKIIFANSEYVYHELTTKCDAQHLFMLQILPGLFYG